MIGFLDDNPQVRRRRVLGVWRLGSLDEAASHIAAARPDEVLVTIPDVAPGRLSIVQTASREAGLPCRLVRRTTEPSPEPLAEVSAE